MKMEKEFSENFLDSQSQHFLIRGLLPSHKGGRYQVKMPESQDEDRVSKILWTYIIIGQFKFYNHAPLSYINTGGTFTHTEVTNW
jgi:hypothetical protein